MGGEVTGARACAGAFLSACCSLALAVPEASASAAPVPALEILWRARAEDGLQWRAFDSAGKPVANERVPAHGPGGAASSSHKVAGPFAERAPLGSIWKLFVYLWLVEQRHPAPDYTCNGSRGMRPNSAAARKHREEETYCCEPGQRVGRDLALVRSCGLFFDPQRLGISTQAWRTFWEAQPGVRDAAPWLADLGAMKPETVVSPVSILSALEAAPARAREEASNTLLARLFAASSLEATELIRGMGGRLRVKSFSWHRLGQPARRYGGGAGWLADGSPVWFAGEGTAQQVMAGHGTLLAKTLGEKLPPGSSTPGCVRVNFFARYPFELEQASGKGVQEGSLRGRFIARFQSGASIAFTSSGELTLSRPDGRARIEGRFSLDDYVARVIDREADAKEAQAARALSVVIRSYLINEASRQGNCLVIDDSSRKQRVSIHPPSQEARAAADFTAGLALSGAPAGYHGTTPSKNRMAWTDAVSASRNGEPWDAILRKTFPKSNLGAMNDPAGIPCQRFAEAENWLASRMPWWHRTLYQRLPGFDAPHAPPDICLLPYGTPFSEQDRGRIHVRALRTAEDRITLAHEYLHLGLRHHPSGHDEALVERWARKLIDEDMP